MSDFKWVESSLDRFIPYLDMSDGVDLDENGRIEGTEKTDRNGDGAVSDNEWRKFLKDNRTALIKLDSNFRHYYSTKIKPNNPIHRLLASESKDIPAKKLKIAYRKINSIAGRIRKLSSKKELTFEKRMQLVFRVLNQSGIRFSNSQAKTGFIDGLIRGKMSTRHKTLLLTALAHEIGWKAEDMDAHYWLEEVEGKDSLAWVEEHNRSTAERLESDPRFEEFLKLAKGALGGDNHLTYPTKRGEYMYYFHRNSKHTRGIWRRTSEEDFWSDEPTWETVLDIDALAKEEEKSWVWKGAECLPPEFERCLLKLSPDGKDATVVREFDTKAKQFVEGGFQLDAAINLFNWLDQDHMLVMTDFGPGSLTKANYPRIIKEWTRGEPLEGARILLEGKEDDFTIYGVRGIRPEGSLDIFFRIGTLGREFHFYLRKPETDEIISVPISKDAELKNSYFGHMIFTLKKAWRPEGWEKDIPAGSLISLDAKHLLEGRKGPPPIEVMLEPKERFAIQNVSVTKDAIYVTALDNLNGTILRFTREDEGGKSAWKSHTLPIPTGSTVRVVMAEAFHDDLYLTLQSHLTQKSLHAYDPKTDTLEMKQTLKQTFDTEGLVVEQHEVTSRDGTKVPYFIVHREDIPYDGSTPTLLHGYGAAGHSMLPRYSKIRGKLWLERGGAYVIANVRGGGEFGAEWHNAALKENRQRSIDDFLSVAEDLIERGITSPRRLGTYGGSFGGALVAAAATQRPDLFNAVVCEVPMLDMMRYSKLHIGHAWIGEYGDPDKPEVREALLGYSPYHNVKPNISYPEMLLTTATSDDRMHPAHARKMAAKMEEMGHSVLFYETTGGGHSKGSSIDQMAINEARAHTYLHQKLFD